MTVVRRESNITDQEHFLHPTFQKTLQQELGIHVVETFGEFSWTPQHQKSSSYKFISSLTSEDCLQYYVTTNNDEPKLVENRKCEMSIPLPDKGTQIVYKFQYPYDYPAMLPLMFAKKNQITNGEMEVDFVVGGSFLGFCAHLGSGPVKEDRYVFMRYKSIIFVQKMKGYEVDKSNYGYVVENYLTGGKLSDKLDPSFSESVSLMRIDGEGNNDFNVVVSAEVDAFEDLMTRKKAEVKTGNPKYLGGKVLFHMISSNSSSLIHTNIYRSKENGAYIIPQPGNGNLFNKYTISDFYNSTKYKERGSMYWKTNLRQMLQTIQIDLLEMSEMVPFVVSVSKDRHTHEFNLHWEELDLEEDAILPQKHVVDSLLN